MERGHHIKCPFTWSNYFVIDIRAFSFHFLFFSIIQELSQRRSIASHYILALELMLLNSYSISFYKLALELMLLNSSSISYFYVNIQKAYILTLLGLAQ